MPILAYTLRQIMCLQSLYTFIPDIFALLSSIDHAMTEIMYHTEQLLTPTSPKSASFETRSTYPLRRSDKELLLEVLDNAPKVQEDLLRSLSQLAQLVPSISLTSSASQLMMVFCRTSMICCYLPLRRLMLPSEVGVVEKSESGSRHSSGPPLNREDMILFPSRDTWKQPSICSQDIVCQRWFKNCHSRVRNQLD